MKETILLTGGAGYIGSHINILLKENGYPTIILDNLSNGHKEFIIDSIFYHCDSGNVDMLDFIFSENRISAVVHLAAFAYVGESLSHPERYYSNNVSNTINLLKVMRKYGVNKIVFSSTCATYGEQEVQPIQEGSSQHPINPYGNSKFMAETIIKDYSEAYGFNYSILRYFNAAGADPSCRLGEWHDPEPHLIPIILDVAIGVREKLDIFGDDYDTPDGTCIRDYVHVSDLAEAHQLTLEDLLQNCRSSTYNLGSERGFSILDVIHTVEKVSKKKIKTRVVDRRYGDPDTLIGSSEKIQKELQWKPKYMGLEAIIGTAWDWHKKLYELYK